MEALKSIIPIACVLGLLGSLSLSKRYSIILKGILAALCLGLGCISLFVWPGKPSFTNDGSAVVSDNYGGGSGNSVAVLKDEPTDSKVYLTISGSSVINDELTIKLAQSYLQTKGYTDISVAKSSTKEKEKYVFATKNGEKIRIVVKSPGTKEGFKDLKDNQADICMASAPADPDFKQIANENVIGLDGIAVVTNANNPVNSISKSDLSKVYSGDVSDWRNVKGASISGPIKLNRMGDKTGIFKMFKELVCSNISTSATAYDKSEQMANAVGEDNNALGFVSYTYLAKNPNIKSIPISDGAGVAAINPNALTIASEKYPLCRRLYMYRLNDGYIPEVNGFINFVKSEQGQQIVENVGFVNLTLSEDNDVAEMSSDPSDYKRLMRTHTKLSSELRFIFGTDNLDSRGYDDIDRLSSKLSSSQYAGKSVVLVGFTDNVGGQDGNKKLAVKRANSLIDNFTNKGINVTGTIGMGMLRPVSDNSTDEGRSHNRRVEVWVQK